MGKIKSAICLTLITLVIAVLCVVCFVPFPLGSNGIIYFNPIINWTDKSADLGGFMYGGDNPNYIGGGFSMLLYPEGVISEKEHKDNLENLTGKELEEYEGQYVSYADGKLWLDKEIVCDGGTNVSEEFKDSFAKRVKVLEKRCEKIHSEGMGLEIVDDYTVRMSLPASMDASVAAFVYFAYMGNLEVSYGSDVSTATRIFPLEGKKANPVSYYMKGAGTRTANGVSYVALHFTNEGRDAIKKATSGAADSSTTLFVTVGGDAIISLTVSDQITEKDLYISGSYSSDTATIVAAVIDTAIEYSSANAELGHMELGDLYQNRAVFGENSLTFVYIAIGVCILAMAAFFLIRYGLLGFAHLYSFLAYFIAMTLLIWWIPFLTLGVNTIVATLIMAVVLSVSNAIAYEYARKEYAVGKTIVSSVKTGYSKCFWHIFDLHIVLIIVGVLTGLIALAELSCFGYVIALGALVSGIASLAVNRFMWFLLMPYAKNAAKFCHFKREEVEDDE